MEPRHHAYDQLTFNSPLSADRAAALVRALGQPTAALDLGCGWAQLLIDLMVASPGTVGTGVDLDPVLLGRGAEGAAQAGVADRLRLVEADLTAVHETADAVIAIGVAHAWGGTAPALESLRERTRPGGRAIYGDGGWMRTPTPEALEIFGPDLVPLTDLPHVAQAAGWTVMDVHQAGIEEWNDFEERWCRGLEVWAEVGEEGALEAIQRAAEHRRTYHDVYRGTLGFGYLILLEEGSESGGPGSPPSHPRRGGR